MAFWPHLLQRNRGSATCIDLGQLWAKNQCQTACRSTTPLWPHRQASSRFIPCRW